MAWNIPSLRSFAMAFAVVVAGFMLMPQQAEASYMIKCNKLIEAEGACFKAGGTCEAETKAILEECKCHKNKGQNDWRLVMAAVGKDGVCAPRTPDDEVKDPVPPPGGGHGGGSGGIIERPEPEGRVDAGPGGGHK